LGRNLEPARQPDQRGLTSLPTNLTHTPGFLSCSQYDRNNPTWRHPPKCTWFDSPSKPTDASKPSPLPLPRSATGSNEPGPSGGGLALATATVGLGALVLSRRLLTSWGR